MDLTLVLLVIGVGLMLAGVIPQIGTSKAERMGKVEVSEAKRRRIKAGNIITAIGFAVCIWHFFCQSSCDPALSAHINRLTASGIRSAPGLRRCPGGRPPR